MSNSAWSVGAAGVRRNLSQDEVDVIKEKSLSLFSKVAAVSTFGALFVTGMTIIGGEVALRYTTNGVQHTANVLADVHTAYVTKVRKSPFLFKALYTAEPRTLPNKQAA